MLTINVLNWRQEWVLICMWRWCKAVRMSPVISTRSAVLDDDTYHLRLRTHLLSVTGYWISWRFSFADMNSPEFCMWLAFLKAMDGPEKNVVASRFHVKAGRLSLRTLDRTSTRLRMSIHVPEDNKYRYPYSPEKQAEKKSVLERVKPKQQPRGFEGPWLHGSPPSVDPPPKFQRSMVASQPLCFRVRRPPPPQDSQETSTPR